MIRQISFGGNPFIGVFARCNDDVLIISQAVPVSVSDKVASALSVKHVIRTFIGGSPVVGALTACNSKSVIVSSTILPDELKALQEHCDVELMPGKMNAAGNIILANDRAALVHPAMSREAVDFVGEALDVEVRSDTIAGIRTVGMAAAVTNKGIIAHRQISPEEIEHLEDIFKVQVGTGTVNYGVPQIGSGLLANCGGYICGDDTTGAEMGRIAEVLGFV